MFVQHNFADKRLNWSFLNEPPPSGVSNLEHAAPKISPENASQIMIRFFSFHPHRSLTQLRIY